MGAGLNKENDMLKLSWVSKLKPPVQKGAEPDEMEIEAQYRYFKRRNICSKILIGSLIFGLAGVVFSSALANALGVDAKHAAFGALGFFTLLPFLGVGLLDEEKEALNRPLNEMAEKDQSAVLRWIKCVPEARKLSERARKQGRSLRAFDLDAMREFEKQREEKRLKREAVLLGVEPESDQPRLGRGAPRVRVIDEYEALTEESSQMGVSLNKKNDMLKFSWVSKLKPPVQKGAEPDEMEIEALYQYLKRKNNIGKAFMVGGLISTSFIILLMRALAPMLGLDPKGAVFGSAGVFLGLSFAWASLIDDKKERLNQPLEQMSQKDRAEALRLIRFVPEARRLSQQARQKGRSLRAFDLEAMREFEKQRDENRLKRDGHRLEIKRENDQGA